MPKSTTTGSRVSQLPEAVEPRERLQVIVPPSRTGRPPGGPGALLLIAEVRGPRLGIGQPGDESKLRGCGLSLGVGVGQARGVRLGQPVGTAVCRPPHQAGCQVLAVRGLCRRSPRGLARPSTPGPWCRQACGSTSPRTGRPRWEALVSSRTTHHDRPRPTIGTRGGIPLPPVFGRRSWWWPYSKLTHRVSHLG